ncbi:DNA-binding response regulator [uncultured Massilia sp.]|uniref:response regulator transcription factor n=1 Tax=uncultured Massilia sp. TaxID=169973 RepID=UPI0025E9D4F9|nr:DNA-binding response regulator [uncultured Massilia sp.]
MPHLRHAIRLLLIDPDEPVRTRLAGLLRRAGYGVTGAAGGAQGVRLAVLDEPHLIVADIRLPDMDGYACCRLLKADPATAPIPLILVGADTGPRERVAGLTLGAVDFLSAPYDDDELLARIRVHLGLVPRAAPPGPLPVPPSIPTPAPGDLDALVVTAARRLIDANLANLPALADIARAAGTYRERLNALFRARLGSSVFDYVRERRHLRAEQLLRETEMDVNDIAQLVGFQNARNFSTAFRERHGLAPVAWRRRERGAAGGMD